MPLVSIIVPIYNVEKYLDACLESIVKQTYTNLEIILVDDGSKDNCGAKCDEWFKRDSRVKVIHKANAGLGFARNSGLDVVTGEYVMYIDSDDYIDESMVEVLLTKAQMTGSDTVYCGLTRVFTDGMQTPVPAVYDNKSFEGKHVIDKVLLEMVGSKPQEKEDAILYMSVWHALYSMDVIKTNNIRFPSEREIMCEDIIYHIDYLRYAKKVVYIKDPLYFYRVNPKSLSQVYDKTRFERQKILSDAIISRLKAYVPEEDFLYREQRRLLGGARSQVLAIVASNEKNKLISIREICNDDTIKRTLKSYPYQLNPLKHRIFNWGMDHQSMLMLYFLSKTMIILRK